MRVDYFVSMLLVCWMECDDEVLGQYQTSVLKLTTGVQEMVFGACNMVFCTS